MATAGDSLTAEHSRAEVPCALMNNRQNSI